MVLDLRGLVGVATWRTLVVRVVVSACMCQLLDGGRREVGLTC